MSIAVVVLVIAAFVAATLLVRPGAARTGLTIWHPSLWWLALTAVFFGIGSARLAIDGRFGPAAYVSGAVLAFALAVAAADRLARRRAGQAERSDAMTHDDEPPDAIPLRPWVVGGLAALGLALIAPTI